MSLQTWKEEFYPTNARSTEALNAPIEHSLRKWKGLTQENMDKHNVRISDRGHWIEDGHETLDLDSDSCSLCQMAILSRLFMPENMCEHCEINKHLNEVCNIAYNEWCNTRDPTIMISLLTRTLDASKTSTP